MQPTVPTEDIIRWRRHIHQHPELSHHETQTTKYIIGELSSIEGLTIERPTPTGLVAILKGEAGNGPTIALRADIDALPVQEENDMACASVNAGVSHVCGHDTHSAMLMGAAKALAARRHELAGTVKFIFQPAEEVAPGGAQLVVAAGVLDDVEACFGLHVMNDPIGLIRVFEHEAITTSLDDVEIIINGRGSHGSMPQHSIDPMLVGSHLVVALHSIVARNVAPGTFAVVSPTVFHCGKAPNVISDSAEIWANLRTRDEQTRTLLKRRIEEITAGIAQTFGAEAKLTWRDGPAAIRQSLPLVMKAKDALIEAFGTEAVAAGNPMSVSEDFSEYSKVCPTAFFTLGGGTAADGYPYANHHPKFNVDERALERGAQLEVALALAFLAKR